MAARSADFADSFEWIRADTLTVLLHAVGVLVWLTVISYVVRPEEAWPGWGTFSLLGAAVGLCYALRRRSYRVSSLLFVAALLGAASAFVLAPGGSTAGLFMFVPIVLIAGVLRGSRAALATAGLATLVLAAAVLRDGNEIALATALSALALFWLTALTSWATTRNLYLVLHWALANSDQAERNLAEVRAYQGQLAAANRRLEETNYRLEQANHALDWARAEAEQARQLKAQFAANISHELRTPINLVVGFAELMLGSPKQYGSPLPEEYQLDLTALHRNAEHLRGLIDDILDLSQIDAGEMPVLLEPTDVGSIVDEALTIARQLLERKGLAVEVELASDLPELPLDRLRIRQVLLNLLNNAARFTEEGGVRIRARRERDRVVVEVVDTGLGIKPERIDELFQPFHMLETSGTRGRGGTGLGLAISKRFVELHGGTIWATSEGIPGRGSTFAFALPIRAANGARPAPGPSEPLRRRSHATTAPATVVVLDDDPAVVSLFQRRLDGYHVIGAATRDQALRTAAERRAHAILTDLPAPSAFASWYAEWSDTAARVAVRVLGCPMPSGRRVARALGLVDYLVKPVTREALTESVQAVAPGARTILVADDEPQMVRLLCRMLGAASDEYRFVRAYDGEQALAKMRQSRPDLVLLDLNMPRVDGLGILERMKAESALAGIPVVVVSARGSFEAISPASGSALVLIADAPLPVGRLLRSVHDVLGGLPPVGALGEPAVERLQEGRPR